MKKLWIIEIWKEEREVFKSLIGHLLIFLVTIGAFLFLNYIINISNLHEDKKEIIEKIDFWCIVIILVILGVSSICKLAILVIKNLKYDIYRIY